MLSNLVSDPTTMKVAIRAIVPGALLWNPALLQNLKIDLRDVGETDIALKTDLPAELETAINWGTIIYEVLNFGIDLFLSNETPGDIITTPPHGPLREGKDRPKHNPGCPVERESRRLRERPLGGQSFPW